MLATAREINKMHCHRNLDDRRLSATRHPPDNWGELSFSPFVETLFQILQWGGRHGQRENDVSHRSYLDESICGGECASSPGRAGGLQVFESQASLWSL